MENPSSKTPWYAAGLAFECSQCGRCCAGPNEGFVWVTKDEIAEIAAFLAIPAADVNAQYVRRAAGRLSLIEHPNRDCIFLLPPDPATGIRGCQVYSCRPRQCRTWPFWPGNLVNPQCWSLAAVRCPGVNRGKLFPLEEIETRASATE